MLLIPPKCPSCGSINGFDSSPFGEYFVLVCCASCGAVVGACELNAVAPDMDEVKGEIQTLSDQVTSIEQVLNQIRQQLGAQ